MDRSLIDWQNVIDAIAIPVSVHDRHHVVRLANRAFLERMGRTAEAVIGQKCHALAHCTEEPILDCPHRELLLQGKAVEREFVSPDGARAVGISCFPLYDPAGDLIGSVHMVRDVTELAGLRQRQDRQNRTIAGYLETVRAYLARFPANLGRPIPFGNPHLRSCREVHACDEADCEVTGQENPRCWHAIGTACERFPGGGPAERLASCHACEVYKAAVPDDLTALTETFNDLLFLLREKEQQVLRFERFSVLGELGAMLAHEMRSPLHALSLAAQRLERRARHDGPMESADVRVAAESIVAEVRRLDAIIDGFARSVARPVQPPRSVALGSVVEDACGGVRHQAARRNVDLVVRCDPRSLEVPGRIAETGRGVLFHLLLNAVEAVPRGGSVSVDCRVVDGRILLVVDDSGPGVPPEIRERVFEPFFTTKTSGTGLGLAVVVQMARRLGGDVVLGRSDAGGARFTVRLPLAAPGREGKGG